VELLTRPLRAKLTGWCPGWLAGSFRPGYDQIGTWQVCRFSDGTFSDAGSIPAASIHANWQNPWI